MEDFKELYILGQPISTELGNIHFFKVKEYPLMLQYSAYLNLSNEDIINHLKRYAKSLPDNLVESLYNLSYLDLIIGLSEVIEVYDSYRELFKFCFKDDVFPRIKDDAELDKYVQMIKDMNCIHYEKKNPNSEIEYFNNLKKIYEKKKSNGELTFESMYTSVWHQLGYEPSDLTIYQLHAVFNRIAQFQNYSTTTLYSTVAEKVQIEPWYKHVSVYHEEEKVTLEEYSDYAKGLLGS